MTSRLGVQLQRGVLPLAVFLGVGLLHFLCLTVFPEQAAEQAEWAAVEESSALARYVESQSYWLGFSYAVALAFAATALRRHREQQLCGARTLAIGGATFSGFLAVAGCYLLGCCGSPMLAVYVSLFGAHFLPLAKPLVATLTMLSVGGAWWWMNRARSRGAPDAPPRVACAP